MTASRRTAPGWVQAHSIARMPPMDPPITRARLVIPSRSHSAFSAATWSRTVSCGKREP